MLLIKMFHLNLENVPSRRTAMTEVDSTNKKESKTTAVKFKTV